MEKGPGGEVGGVVITDQFLNFETSDHIAELLCKGR